MSHETRFPLPSSGEQSAQRGVAVAVATLSASCLLVLSSCSDAGSSEISVTRELSQAEKDDPVAVDVAPEERFRFASMGLRQATTTDSEASDGATPGGSGAQLKWDTPEGWKEGPGSAMRDINLVFGPEDMGECYVARLPGAAGGLESNVNRWRQQMGQEALSEEDIAALPKREIFGTPATYVSIDGNFTGMGGKPTIEDARMLGMILMTPNGALFIKMTGPKQVVAQNTEKFEAFCSSLRLE